MSYTKNLTVTNLQDQGVTLILRTTEPAGSTLSWPKNNTYLPVNQTTSADLTLTTAAQITAGDYNWMLLASNSTASPTPTPTNSGTPTPERFNCTIIAGTPGVQFITVTYINRPGSGITIPVDMLPYKLPFTAGDTLKFETTPLASYLFNAYQFSDGTAPQNTPTVTLTATDEFTITAILILDPTP